MTLSVQPKTQILALALVGLALLVVGCDQLFPPKDSDSDGIPDKYDNCPSQPGPRSNGGCPIPPPVQSMDLKVWTDKQVYSIGEQITIYFSTSMDASLTLTNLLPNGSIVTYFTSQFYGPGTYTYTAWSNPPAGDRTLTLQGVDNKGKTVYAYYTYKAGCPTPGFAC